MCGIAGYWEFKNHATQAQMRAIGLGMGEAIGHRGPDAADAWADAEAGICLVHRRLAIIDLTPTGVQPMESASGRYVIVFNGEIYNFQELRPQLEGPWRGTSDTEVLLAAIEQWGLEKTLPMLDGMFAFALWDKQQRTLTLARDRMGEKPLYYGQQGSTLLFGSELKALREHPSWQGRLRRDVLPLYLRHNYIPAPYSIYAHINKLMPGQMLTITPDGVQHTHRYYDLADELTHTPRHTMSDAEALEELERLLMHSIQKRMISDVPLGAFLSGGIDSSAIVALMQAQSDKPVHSFTMGFEVPDYNEADHARAVAQHLGTHHTEMMVTPADALAVIPKLPTLYDEPFADVSQIPTHMVSEIARKHVTVALSGDAGDELFAGYNRYFWGTSIWNKLRVIPRPLRAAMAGGIRAVPVGGWNRMYGAADMLLKRGERNVGEKMHKLSRIVDVRDEAELYRRLVSQWQNPASALIEKQEPDSLLARPPLDVKELGFTRWMQGMDMLTYLPDDILCKVDRAAMGVALETRIPFLDPAIVSFAAGLPRNQTIRGGKGKWLLRELLYKHVPREMIERPKMGFGVPIDHWLRGELKDWAADLLDPKLMKADGIFDAAAVQREWGAHQSGKVNRQYQLWGVLMFQAWKRHYD